MKLDAFNHFLVIGAGTLLVVVGSVLGFTFGFMGPSLIILLLGPVIVVDSYLQIGIDRKNSISSLGRTLVIVDMLVLNGSFVFMSVFLTVGSLSSFNNSLVVFEGSALLGIAFRYWLGFRISHVNSRPRDQ